MVPLGERVSGSESGSNGCTAAATEISDEDTTVSNCMVTESKVSRWSLYVHIIYMLYVVRIYLLTMLTV